MHLECGNLNKLKVQLGFKGSHTIFSVALFWELGLKIFNLFPPAVCKYAGGL